MNTVVTATTRAVTAAMLIVAADAWDVVESALAVTATLGTDADTVWAITASL